MLFSPRRAWYTARGAVFSGDTCVLARKGKKMEKFQFLSPTKIIFGKGVEEEVGTEVKKYGRKVLLHYGGGSIKRSGLMSGLFVLCKQLIWK